MLREDNIKGELKMKLRTKKAQSQMWWIIIAAVIAVVVSVLIIMWFKGAGDKGFGGVSDTISKLDDSDKDDVADYFDKCPCEPASGLNAKYEGCPSGVDETTIANYANDKSCYTT
jgi:hypothetical protein